jgi:hypothetical protein
MKPPRPTSNDQQPSAKPAKVRRSSFADRVPSRPTEQYLIVVECKDEAEQVKLLERFRRDAIKCRALLS